MRTVVNPIFQASVPCNDFNAGACDSCVQVTESWVRQKRDPAAETYSPGLYLAGFQGPYAPNKMATWAAADENGSLFVLARRQEKATENPWYVLTKYNPCGDLVKSIHINKGRGFGHYLDVTSNPQVCVGPQGVVIAASPAFHPNGGILNGPLEQPNSQHVVACFSANSLSLEWAVLTSIGMTSGFNNLLGLYANKKTGHTYLFERYGGAGFNSGDIGMTTISEGGDVTGKCLYALPSTPNAFQPCLNDVDSLLTRPDGSVCVFGTHTEIDVYGIGQDRSFSWSVIFEPNGSSTRRNYFVSALSLQEPVMRGLGGCVRADGKMLLASDQGKTFVLSSDATSVDECWQGGWNGSRKSQMATAEDGKIYWLDTGTYATPDLPSPEWNSMAPAGDATMRLRLFSPDGKYVLKSKAAKIGSEFGVNIAGYATDTITTSRDRVGMVVNGWGLVSFSLSGKTTGFELAKAYVGQEFYTYQDTYAKFSKYAGASFYAAGASFTPPSLNAAPFHIMGAESPLFLTPSSTTYHELDSEKSATDVKWDSYSASEQA